MTKVTLTEEEIFRLIGKITDAILVLAHSDSGNVTEQLHRECIKYVYQKTLELLISARTKIVNNEIYEPAELQIDYVLHSVILYFMNPPTIKTYKEYEQINP